jgi:arylsulfatase A-like enzyme
VHVPLAIIWPGQVPAGRRVTAPVATQDLAATILDLLELEGESTLPGHSLARWWETEPREQTTIEQPVSSEIIHASTTPPDLGNSPVSRGPMQCVLLGSLKYIRNGDGVEELYELARDQQERVNLVARDEYRAVLRRCRAALPERRDPNRPAP